MTAASQRLHAAPQLAPVNPGRAVRALAAVLIVLVAFVSYSNTLQAPFVFDDTKSITENAHIGDLLPTRQSLMPAPEDSHSFSSRPLAMFTVALNYRISGLDVWSYRLTNILLHAAAGVVLLGVVHQLLRTPSLAERWGRDAFFIACAAALLWVGHPLATGTVSQVARRSETLMAIFFLLTLYGTIRGAETGRHAWYALAVTSCALGMTSKEVMVSAPLAALLCDRMFLAPSMREIFRRRWGLYAGLFGSWIVLAVLVSFAAYAHPGVGTRGELTPWTYLCTQAWAVVHYLRLSFWPYPLVLDYGDAGHGVRLLTRFSEYAPYGVAVLALLAVTVVLVVRQTVIGFAGAMFFLLLGPSSSVVPMRSEVVAEHRMYLSLAWLILMVVIVGHGMMRRVKLARLSPVVVGTLVIVLAWVTFQRNDDYRDEVTIWRDAIAKHPENARAHANLAVLLRDRGEHEASLDAVRRAYELARDDGSYAEDLGLSLLQMGRLSEALDALREAKRLGHESAKRLSGEGWILFEMGQYDEAIRTLRAAIALDPKPPANHGLLGMALLARDRVDEAVAAFENLLRVDPNNPGAHTQLGLIARGRGQIGRAVEHFQAALRADPNFHHARQELESLGNP